MDVGAPPSPPRSERAIDVGVAGSASTTWHSRKATPMNCRQMVHNVALVLGGGGAAGQAWEIGIIAGLAEAGLDMTEAADLVVGTSAGATAAAQVRSGIPTAELLASVLSPPVQPAGQNRAPPPPRQPIYDVRWARSGWRATPYSDPGRDSGAQWSPPGCLALNGRRGR